MSDDNAPDPQRKVTVLIAEDQAMMRGALTVLLNLEPDIEVIAEVAEGDRILPEAERVRPDVALLDIELPGMSGIDACALLRQRLPDCRVIIVTTFGRPGYLRRALDAGASGFLVKDGPVDGLARAIRSVVNGQTVIDPDLAAGAIRAGESPLTDREREVLAAAEDGARATDIAKRLHLSDSTVRNYLSSAISKTGTRNRIEAVKKARELGWL
ncbi:response regulator transcription factor [Stackebrandtia nassauensis]|uniref:Two component transcriptional regulator, LuxR family n=1 Tax=Stackebrandtia nassauensis (strain DSM 44728 / CIP 108903 / NRRL B-16338 / NBRC 102104 / LLR-40K-21) TaxID=446470 RepID=D3Q0M6_STANL|nr:response regulator transcription factor [Stackebrandtia nassauensis]ADD41762.1 two component transcriptional regulator, LuxR family [Stackebrandtia nassauensis DSM 44728]